MNGSMDDFMGAMDDESAGIPTANEGEGARDGRISF